MSEEEKISWDKRYSSDDYLPRQMPSDLLAKWLGKLPPGKALDLACGTGRNSIYLAEKGYEVTAVDVSSTAITMACKRAQEKGLVINWIVADLDSFEIRGQYDVIVNFFYVNKNIVPAIIKSLKPEGILICENHMASPAPAEEPHGHRFHFQPGELRKLFTGLQVLHYEEHQKDEEGGRLSYLASLVACKG